MSAINTGMIIRSNISRMLDDMSAAQVIYICAPAGYGKTVAVRQWLDGDQRAKAILSLDEYDNNITSFCRRFCAALLDCQPNHARLAEIVSHPAFDGAPDEFAIRAVDMLNKTKHTVFVMDDLYLIQNDKVLRFLLVLLKRLPENIQIVFISRYDLPSGFSDLWIKGELARLTPKQLRFSREEIESLYKKRGVHISSEQVNNIYRFTDGWAIAINALLLSDGNPHGESIEHLDEFIRTNVWQRWDAPTRQFMLKTSVISELTPPLCAALTGEPDCGEVLERLVRHNTFISRTRQGVYQYHRLFREFLQKLPELCGMERSLLEKAGYWYLAERDFHSAMEYFTKCENLDGIVKCFEYLSGSSSEFASIEKLVSVADSPLVLEAAKKHPFINAFLVWIYFNKGRAADMAYYADRYYENQNKIIRADPRFASASILILLIDFRNSISDLKKSVLKIFMFALRMKFSGVEADLGVINQNMPLMHRGTRDISECAIGNPEANIVVVKKLLRGLLGGYGAMLMACVTAGLLYEQGHLQKAHSLALAANAEIQEHFSPESKFIAMATLVYVLDASQQHDEADKAMKQIADMIEHYNAFYLSYNFNALNTRRKIGNGDIKAARDWLSEHETLHYGKLDFYKFYGHLTTCRAYIATGEYDTAIILLTKALALAESYNRPLDIIESQILLSIACWRKKRGFQDDAMRHLERVVSIAHGYGYTQLFINEGAELAGMLQRLQRRAEQHSGENMPPASFVKMLHLKTLEHPNSGLTSGLTEPPVKYTDKQLLVMKLLCDGKSYKEIAVIMGIKLPTLRSHLALIYKKLDVTSGTDAVKRIHAMGLLENI